MALPFLNTPLIAAVDRFILIVETRSASGTARRSTEIMTIMKAQQSQCRIRQAIWDVSAFRVLQ